MEEGTVKGPRVSTAIPATPVIPAAPVEVTVKKERHTEQDMSTRRRKRRCIRRKNQKIRRIKKKNLRRNINEIFYVFSLPQNHYQSKSTEAVMFDVLIKESLRLNSLHIILPIYRYDILYNAVISGLTD